MYQLFGRRFRPGSLVTVFAALFFGSPSAAQETGAGITGIVTDSGGGVIVGASVTANQLERNLEWHTGTNAKGVYGFPRIPPGTYDVTVKSPGFRTALKRNVQLEVNQRARIDIELELGLVTEVMEVAGKTPLLSTEKTEVGVVVNGATTTGLPLNGRNFTQLTLLIPGATAPNLDSFTEGERSTIMGGRPFVNGNREQANNFLLDGMDANHSTSNVQAYQPGVDAIQEFKITTSNPAAEFGNVQGAIINVVLKSGTNEFHGNAFEFFRNDKLNANEWARNWQGVERGLIRHNVFGGTFGGPIVKNKLFFFVDYTGTRRATPGGSPDLWTVIPNEFREGDFARLMSERNRQLYDPFSDPDLTGMRMPFPNNQIPLSLQNPVATNLFRRTDLYPSPTNNGLERNMAVLPTRSLINDQGDIKADYKFSGRDDLSVRYSQGRHTVVRTDTGPLSTAGLSERPFQNGLVNWTRTFGPTIVNEFRAAANRINLRDSQSDKGVGNIAEELGIRNGNVRGPGLPSLRFVGGLAAPMGSHRIGVWRDIASNNYHLSNNLTIIQGRHMMKSGVTILRRQADNFHSGSFGTTGFLEFNGQFTTGPDANKAPKNTGLPEADFFLGLPANLGLGVQEGTVDQRSTVWGVYIQDDWRATGTLTLNLGFRWENTTPMVEANNRQANFEPFTGKHLLAGRDGASRALYVPYYKDFQPRVGFAWTPRFLGGNTVLRGSYAITSYMEGMGLGWRLAFNPPFMTEFSRQYFDSFLPPTRTDDGLAGLEDPEDPFDGANPRLWDPFVRPAMVQQWNLLIERQLPGQTLLSVGYLGNHGTHLVNSLEYSQRQLQADGSTLPGPYLAGNPELRDKLSRIFGTETNASSRYDSLQVNLRRRFNAGLEYQLSYTFSKTMGNSRGFFGTTRGQDGVVSARSQNIYDFAAEWGPVFFHNKHNFVFSSVYDLPFGYGKRYGGSWHSVVDGILGDWRLSGILMHRTGFPITPSARDLSGTNSMAPRADRLADGEGPKQVGPGSRWLDVDAFAQPVKETFGSSGNGVVVGPGAFNLDVAVEKEFLLDETRRFEVRAGFFGLTNTPRFDSPNRNVHAPNFGEVLGAQGSRQIQIGLKFYF